MTKRRKQRSPLGTTHKRFIAQEIARLAEVARTRDHQMRRIARFLCDSLLWCWTADGVDADGGAVRDGLKYDFVHQRHTRAARSRWERNRGKLTGLRHEHAVPRKVLLDYILEQRVPLGVECLEALLKRHCIAVIVTKEEDRRLRKAKLKDCMPGDWNWGDNPLARYRTCDPKLKVLEPTGSEARIGVTWIEGPQCT